MAATKGRVLLIVLDGLGIGALPDADEYGDGEANTLKNISNKVGGFEVPCLERLGLGNLGTFKGIEECKITLGGYSKIAAKSKGKESVIGHWELTGIISKTPFPLYPDGFPHSFLKRFEKAIGMKTIGNVQMTGQELIRTMEIEHFKTKLPIVYCAQDSSCFQLAAHEEIIPVDTLYAMCEKAKELFIKKRLVARVIAKPFHGPPGSPLKSNKKRKDYTCSPPHETVLDRIISSGMAVVGVGRIGELYNFQGISRSIKTGNNNESIETTIKELKTLEKGLLYVNLKDFDSLYGHARDYSGFKDSLECFDSKLDKIIKLLSENDLLIITADHGLDSTIGTDHTREYVPLLVYQEKGKKGVNLGMRETFADVGQTVLDYFNCQPMPNGKSFLPQILNS